jgi:hypothetical protein
MYEGDVVLLTEELDLLDMLICLDVFIHRIGENYDQLP